MFCEAIDGVKSSRPSRIASGSTDCRQTISRSPTVSASIWSSGEYFVPAASEPYDRHSTFWASAAVAAPAAKSATIAAIRASIFRTSCLEGRVPIFGPGKQVASFRLGRQVGAFLGGYCSAASSSSLRMNRPTARYTIR